MTNRRVIAVVDDLDEKKRVEILDLALQARLDGFEPIFAVDVRTPHDIDLEGNRVHRVLDNSELYEVTWADRSSRLLTLDRHSLWADRLGFLHEVLDLGFDDQILLPFASLADVDLLWPYLLTTSAMRPSIAVRLTQLLPLSVATSVNHRFSVANLLATLRRRLHALGLVDSDRFQLCARHEQVARVLTEAGLPTAFTDDMSGSSADRLLLITADLRADWITAALDEATHGKHTVIVVPDSMFDDAANERSSDPDNMVDIRPLTSIGLLARSASRVEVSEDLETVVLSVPETATTPMRVHGREIDEISLHTASLVELSRSAYQCATPPTERDVVLHIAPNWGGLGCSHVFEAQLRYLESLDVLVLAVHVDVNDLHRYSPDGFEDLTAGLPARGAAHRWSLVREPDEIIEYDQNVTPSHERPFLSFEGETRAGRQVAVPRTLSAALAARPTSWVLCNYGHLMPVVRRLGLGDRPVICETHDVRAEQHRIQNGLAAVDPDNETLEVEAWGRSAGVVFINDDERKAFGSKFPEVPAVTAIPFFIPVESGSDDTGFVTPASSLLKAAAGSSATPTSMVLDLVRRRNGSRADGRKVVLFVGSDHDANVESLDWYIQNVHIRRLASQGIELMVAGNIAKSYQGMSYPGVHFLGRVDDLDDVYLCADVTVLPVTAGTGMPIKTIDSVLRKMPFVATHAAVKAVPELVAAVETFDDPNGFADEVVRLLSNSAPTEVDAGSVSEWDHYVGQWDSVLSAAGIDASGSRPTEPNDDQHTVIAPRPARTMLTNGDVPLAGVELVAGTKLIQEGILIESAYCRFAVPDTTAEQLAMTFMSWDTTTTADLFVDGTHVGRTSLRGGAEVTLRVDAGSIARVEPGWVVVEALLSYPCTDRVFVGGSPMLLSSVSWKTATAS